MFTPAEKEELQEDAQTIAYQAIRFSGAHETFKANGEWDALAKEWGAEIVALLSRKCEATLEGKSNANRA